MRSCNGRQWGYGVSSNDYGEPVSPVRRAWENGGRQYYEERTRQAAREASVIDHSGQMDVCTPVRRHYATSPGYTLREQEYLVHTGQLDGGLAAPAGWREPQSITQGTVNPVQRLMEERIPPASRIQQAQRPIVYAEYRPEFDPDLHPLPVRAAKPKATKPVLAPVAVDDPDAGELPPGMTPADWLAQRHVVSVARKAVADPASVSYVPVVEEEPQLVVTPAGFRYTARFEHLEIRR